jgi:hypothetical protein
VHLSAGYDPILPWIFSNETTWHLHDQVLSDFEPIQKQEGKSGNCNMSVKEALALGIARDLGGLQICSTARRSVSIATLSWYHCYVFHQEIESRISQNGYW